jgi:hypothetical protein
MNTVITYIFGTIVTTIYIYISFISRSMSKSRYRFRKVSALISLILGGLIDYAKIYSKPFGFFLICGMGPLIYLTYYELFRRLYRPWIGGFPYAPYRERKGQKVFGKGYPKSRVVNNIDYLFAISMYLFPILTVIILLTLIEK